MFRVGLGYDIHRLTEGRDLIIGGVKITHEKVVHALIDALLGAVGLDDIGTLFPDTDPKYKDADSTKLLKHVIYEVAKLGYKIVNIDSNIIAQAPKMMPYIPKMKTILADVAGLEPGQISIKAKTKEKLDAVGEGLAIEANAVVLLTKD